MLIKHVLAGSNVPKGMHRQLEKAFSNFLWGSTDGERKLRGIKWSDLCHPVAEEGVGIRSLDDVFQAFSCKLWWMFCKRESLWADFMHLKYCRGLHPCQVQNQE